MDRTYSTTEEEEKALAFYADQAGETADVRWAYINKTELSRLVNGFRDVDKQKLAEVYAKAEKADKDVIDSIVAKVSAAEAISVEPVKPIEPIEPVIEVKPK